MLINYFKIAWRNLLHSKVFSIINIIGLAIGLSCFILIAVFVYDELSFDKQVANAKNIYRVQVSVAGNGNIDVYPNVDAGVGVGMQSTFPEIKACTKLTNVRDFVKYEDKQFKEAHLAFADSNFLELFSIPLLEGSLKEALVQPNSIVISKALATKYFGDSGDALNKTLLIGRNLTPFKVTGLYDKVPDNRHFHFDAFLSLSSFHLSHLTWSNVGYYTYLKLDKNADPKKLQAKFPQLVEKYVVPEVQQDMGISLAEAQKSVATFVFSLQPLTDIHLFSHTKYEIEAGGDIQYVYIFSALALFILLLACVNFTNLSTARAVKRAKEVGIRKVMGSAKNQLVLQFLAESVLLAFLSLLFAYGFILLLLPTFNQVANKNIHFNDFFSYQIIVGMLSVSALVGILAGLYPAFFLSSFNTIKVLKGAISWQSSQKNGLRSSLMVFQFFVSTALMIATIIVYQQLHFMQNKKLGYNKDQVIVLPDARLLNDNQTAFQQRLLQDSRVVSVSISRAVPGGDIWGGTQVFPKNETSNGAEIHIDIFNVDYDYLRTLGMHVLQGRNFSKNFASDSSGVVINQAAVRELGWTADNAIGKTIVASGQHEFKVIGIVEDFHYVSVKQKIAPLMMKLGNNLGGLIVKIKTKNVEGFLADLKTQWTTFNPTGPLSYSFLDDQFAALYAGEQRTQQLFTAFAVLAIIIASLGLFALSAFTIEQRTKEIGIRKVLGASVQEVLVLVSKEFLLLVGLAFLIAIPITWWAMSVWLQNFAYRINISIWIFVVAGIAAALIAFLTISYQAIKAAVMNPVKSLKTE